MIKKFAALFLIIAMAVIYSPFSGRCSAKEMAKISALELRQMQTRYFDTSNTEKVYASLISTLQDGGFVVSIFEDELGYITARNDYTERRTDKVRVTGYSILLGYYIALTVFSFGLTAPYLIDPIMRCTNEISPKHIVIDSNVLVEPYGNKTKVRVNFIEKVYNKADGVTYLKPNIRRIKYIDNPEIYQEFFNEANKSLFIEKSNL